MSEETVAPGPKKNKKSRKKGSSRSIETLFRSAYRTQLALTSIADTKANIMISVNGFIITGIIATTGVFAGFGGWFKYLPLMVLLNSVASMLFAVMAAKPKFSQSTASAEDVKTGKASLLYFANFKKVSEQEYTAGISKLIEDSEDVYTCMSRHIYNLGYVLTQKYHYLKIAYSIFLYGMIAISILFTAMFLSESAIPTRGIEEIHTPPFASIYEPSGIVYVGDGEFLVIEDEPQRPFHKVKLDANGRLRELGAVQLRGVPILLNDLEGIAFDGRYVYAITSHSLSKSGHTDNGRMTLVRYDYREGALHEPKLVQDLKEIIVSQLSTNLPQLSKPDIWKTINIEAMTWHPPSKSLFIAFRAPVLDGKSLIMQIQNPDEVFANQTAEQAKTSLSWLDLDNSGIRAMSWDKSLNGFFIVSGRLNTKSNGFNLWKWAALADVAPTKLSSKDRLLPNNTEGLSTFAFAANSGMIVVIDDGNEELDMPGHYKLITLAIEPAAYTAGSAPES